MNARTTRLEVRIRTPSCPDLNQIYEGEVPLADQQTYQLNRFLGDGKSEVVVGLDMAEKDFGQGGGVFVSVKLTCHQDDQTIDYMARAAAGIAQKHLTEQFNIHKQLLQNYRLVK